MLRCKANPEDHLSNGRLPMIPRSMSWFLSCPCHRQAIFVCARSSEDFAVTVARTLLSPAHALLFALIAAPTSHCTFASFLSPAISASCSIGLSLARHILTHWSNTHPSYPDCAIATTLLSILSHSHHSLPLISIIPVSSSLPHCLAFALSLLSAATLLSICKPESLQIRRMRQAW